MMMKIVYLVAIMFVLCPFYGTAQHCVSIPTLKEMVRVGFDTVDKDLYVEGICISYHKAENLETNLNETYTSVNTSFK